MLAKYLHTISLCIAFGAKVLYGQETTGHALILHELPAGVTVTTGAQRMDQWLPLLKGKSIGVVANQTSLVGNTHLVDTLLGAGLSLRCVFAPEHGFRGQAGAGETVASGIDGKTGLPVISLYGKKKKPDASDLQGIQAMLFDIQDVGTRFYTYSSTLQYVMEACAAAHIPVIVLDRPNPNGFYVDGPVLEKEYASFVGLNPIPVVHGLTMGEYAKMLNGEYWLSDSLQCDLTVITCDGYSHFSFYDLPVPPSPNLPNMASIYLYPTLCLFEGTAVSVARGTDYPFQVVGYPGFGEGELEFTPVSIPGKAPHPPYEGQVCKGIDLREFGSEYIRNIRKLYLFWLMNFYKTYPNQGSFFNGFFNKLAGNASLQQQIRDGWTEARIRASWEDPLAVYKKMRKRYLLYEDFD